MAHIRLEEQLQESEKSEVSDELIVSFFKLRNSSEDYIDSRKTFWVELKKATENFDSEEINYEHNVFLFFLIIQF